MQNEKKLSLSPCTKPLDCKTGAQLSSHLAQFSSAKLHFEAQITSNLKKQLKSEMEKREKKGKGKEYEREREGKETGKRQKREGKKPSQKLSKTGWR